MKIAKVIVDVPALSINQTFDYKVPKKLQSIIEPGMRVVVPFGPRRIIGFIIELSEESDVDKLRSIIDLLDLTPVLTKELIDVGLWMANKTLSFYITAFQAMLPQVLKATYKKEVEVLKKDLLPNSLQSFFLERNKVTYDEIIEKGISYQQLRKAVNDEAIKINYLIQSRITKKYRVKIHPPKNLSVLQEAIDQLPKNAVRQREILQFFIDYPKPIHQQTLTQKLKFNYSSLQRLCEKGLLFKIEEEVMRNPYDDVDIQPTDPLPLTQEQEQSIQPILKSLKEEKHDVFLIHGVTGSGKTEIYLQAIDRVLDKGKEAIVLVPEISLTPQMVKRFKGRFGEKVAVLHSALSAGEKYDEWRRIQKRDVQVVVGARSAIFAPFENLGIIIIDEEHETSYKQEEQPRYHAKDVAIYRAKKQNCPVVLGSATPTLESYARAQKGIYQLQTLKKRTNKKPLPRVEIVDMRKELHAGNRTMFSRKLTRAIKDRMNRGEQTVLLLNRRGFSTFILCRDCGYVAECPNCDIALTFHKNIQCLKCHYCSYQKHVPKSCHHCNSNQIRYFGTGTQRVEEALYEHIPEIQVIRMDVDTTRRKGSHERLLQRFENKEAHVLLGTQMIAKGLDFPGVTLVGVLAADSMLHLPDFRSSERTFQLLTQVSGRAGRHDLEGEVIVQTYSPDHYSIQFASTYDFQGFYQKEMNIRRTFCYPPFVYLSLITVSHPKEEVVLQVTRKITQTLIHYVQKDTVVLGPTPSPILRIKNRYRYQCMVKYRNEPNLSIILRKILDYYQHAIEKNQLQIQIDMQPYQFM